MKSVASRDLRNHTADVLRRVAHGEELAVTVCGETVAELRPPADRRPRYFNALANGLPVVTQDDDFDELADLGLLRVLKSERSDQSSQGAVSSILA